MRKEDEAMKQSPEEHLMYYSIMALVGFAILSIIVGILLQSELILYDGIYSVISIVMSWISLKIIQYVNKHDNVRFPFGKNAIEPVVVFVQYMVLNIVICYMVFDAFNMIISGGSNGSFILTVIYILVTTFLQYIFTLNLRKKARLLKSDIAKTEVIQWEISLKESFYISGGYLLGVIFLLLGKTSIQAYIDPIIIIIFSVVAFNQIFPETLNSFKEIIGMSTTTEDVTRDLISRVERVRQRHHIQKSFVRMRKIGAIDVLEVDFLVDNQFEDESIRKQDEIREEILKAVYDDSRDLWLNITFTGDVKWVEQKLIKGKAWEQ